MLSHILPLKNLGTFIQYAMRISHISRFTCHIQHTFNQFLLHMNMAYCH
jgi:hypothetical protein